MAAYIVALIDVSDPERFAAYQALARTVVERWGGSFLVSSTTPEVLEGNLHPQRVVLVGFDTVERCRAFYDSPEYQEAIQARQGAARLQILAVEGLDDTG